MRYPAFHSLFKDFTVFSLKEIRGVDPSFQRRRLNDWQEKGYLKKIVKGYYFFAETPLTENALFEIANRIYPPSYLSLETALALYGLIPEAVYGITSVATRPTRTFETPIASFFFRTISPRLYFGYEVRTYGEGKHFSIASPEKAILDYLYLNPSIASAEDFEGVRIDPKAFGNRVKENVFLEYLNRYRQKSLSVRAEALRRFMADA